MRSQTLQNHWSCKNRTEETRTANRNGPFIIEPRRFPGPQSLQLRLPILRTGRSFGLTGGLRQRPCDAFGQPSQQMRSSRSPCSEHSVHLRGIECVRAKTCVSMSMCMCALASCNQSVAISEMRIERGTHQSLLSSSGRSLHARRQWWGKLPMVRGAQSPIDPRNDTGHTLS